MGPGYVLLHSLSENMTELIITQNHLSKSKNKHIYAIIINLEVF
jgi:hypothetical protein